MQSAVLALYSGGGLIRDLAPNRQPGLGLFVVRVSMPGRNEAPGPSRLFARDLVPPGVSPLWTPHDMQVSVWRAGPHDVGPGRLMRGRQSGGFWIEGPHD